MCPGIFREWNSLNSLGPSRRTLEVDFIDDCLSSYEVAFIEVRCWNVSVRSQQLNRLKRLPTAIRVRGECYTPWESKHDARCGYYFWQVQKVARLYPAVILEPQWRPGILSKGVGSVRLGIVVSLGVRSFRFSAHGSICG